MMSDTTKPQHPERAKGQVWRYQRDVVVVVPVDPRSPSDLCARPGCGLRRDWGGHLGGGSCVFVEAAPVADEAVCGRACPACGIHPSELEATAVRSYAAGLAAGMEQAENAVAAVQCASKADVEVVNDCIAAIRAARKGT